MKIYKPKKWLVVVRVISLFSLMLLLGTTVLDTSYSVNINNVNLNKSLEVAVMEENHENLYVAELYDAEATFTGDLTAYVGDCPLCSGILACHPRTNVLESGIYFNDCINAACDIRIKGYFRILERIPYDFYFPGNTAQAETGHFRQNPGVSNRLF